jgi:hypothetical protein
MVELEPPRPIRAANEGEEEEQKIEVPVVIRPDDFIVGAFSPRIIAEQQSQRSVADSDDSVSEPDLLIDDDFDEEQKDNVS